MNKNPNNITHTNYNFTHTKKPNILDTTTWYYCVHRKKPQIPVFSADGVD
jgi:hypothetical protein